MLHAVRLMILLAGCAGCATTGPAVPPSQTHAMLDRSVSGLGGQTLSGTTVELEKLRGLVIVLEFFAQYCEPCVRSLPLIDRLNYRYDDVLFVAVSADELESAARKMVAETGIVIPVIYDGGVLAARMGVSTLPTTMIVDRHGVVRWVTSGNESSEGELRMVIDSLK